MIEQTTTTQQFCYNHPTRETLLRCNRCERPICTDCAVLTPTGYRCKECVRGLQKNYDTARWFDYPMVILIAGVLGYLGSLVAGMLGFFTIFIAPVAGVLIAEAVRWATRKRRSRLLFRIATAAAAVGGIWLPLLSLAGLLMGSFFNIWELVWGAVYVILVTSTVYYRLTGIRIN
ncbi:MAG: B-box zinc finger protein [Bellilinea sp.]